MLRLPAPLGSPLRLIGSGMSFGAQLIAANTVSIASFSSRLIADWRVLLFASGGFRSDWPRP